MTDFIIPEELKNITSLQEDNVQEGFVIPENLMQMEQERPDDIAIALRQANLPNQEPTQEAQLYQIEEDRDPAFAVGLARSFKDIGETGTQLALGAGESLGVVEEGTQERFSEASRTVREAEQRKYSDSPISYRLGYLVPYLIPVGAAVKGAASVYKASPMVRTAVGTGLGYAGVQGIGNVIGRE